MRWRISYLQERLRSLAEKKAEVEDEIEKVLNELEHWEDMQADAEMAKFAEYAAEES
jgi:chaperonin cofactor prefoldin